MTWKRIKNKTNQKKKDLHFISACPISIGPYFPAVLYVLAGSVKDEQHCPQEDVAKRQSRPQGLTGPKKTAKVILF